MYKYIVQHIKTGALEKRNNMISGLGDWEQAFSFTSSCWEKGIRAKACSGGRNEMCSNFRKGDSRELNSQGKDHRDAHRAT